MGGGLSRAPLSERCCAHSLQDVVEAMGGIGWLANRTKLNRENLYRVFSQKGNPRFFTLVSILNAIEIDLSLKTKITEKKMMTRRRGKRESRITKNRRKSALLTSSAGP